MSNRIDVKRNVLSENDRIAEAVRREFDARRIVALNMVSSPGSGKTSLLEKTLKALSGRLSLALVAGDVQTDNDARRLVAAGGVQVQSIVTGGACHLDALMVQTALKAFDLNAVQLVFIENVGNLVCPASYDLGEDMKVVLMSTTEGEDKPLKYPAMFRRSGALVMNKMDLLGHSDFDLGAALSNALRINGRLSVFEMSCRTGQGLAGWYRWLDTLVARKTASGSLAGLRPETHRRG